RHPFPGPGCDPGLPLGAPASGLNSHVYRHFPPRMPTTGLGALTLIPTRVLDARKSLHLDVGWRYSPVKPGRVVGGICKDSGCVPVHTEIFVSVANGLAARGIASSRAS